jgi:hypothetical protein
MLGGKYRYDLNAIGSRANGAFAQLLSQVQSVTGTREDAREKAELIAVHWRREMYGFGTAEELDQQLATRRTIAWIVVACVCLGLGSIARRIGKPEANQTPLEVPADLTMVKLPGMQYRVNLVTGLVMDKEMWDEIKTTTTYFHGTYGQHTGETRTESVRKGKAHLLTHDGKEDILNLVGYGHNYRPGNIVTFLFYGRGKKRNSVVVYNHATQKTEEQNGLDHAHGSLWMLNLIVTGVIAYLVFDWASAPMQRLGFGDGTWILIQSVGVALILTAAVHFLTRWRRNRRFRKNFEPRLQRFLQDGDADIQKAFQRLIGEAPS